MRLRAALGCAAGLAFVLAACNRSSRPATAAGGSASARTGARQSVRLMAPQEAYVPAPQLLAAAGPDTVRVLQEGPARNIVWTRTGPRGRRVFWRSDDIYGSAPRVVLRDLNADGTTDLFWSIAYEEIFAHEFQFDVAGRAVSAYVDRPQCGPAALETGPAGARLTIPLPGAYRAEDCDDPIMRVCMDALHLGWPERYRVAGTALVPDRTRADMLALADAYTHAAAHADSVYAAGTLLPGSSERMAAVCGAEVPTRLRALADSARSLASAP